MTAIETGFVSPKDIPEALKRSVDHARELLGDKNVFGPKEVEKAFGFRLDAKDVPLISFTKEELQQAHADGEQLVLRIDKLPDRKPLTLANLTEYLAKQGRRVFVNDLADIRKDVVGNDMEFFTREPLQARWMLTKSKEISGTRHLSYEAQNAFMQEDFDSLATSLKTIPLQWDEQGIPGEARPRLPTLDELKVARDQLPPGASLPSAVEVVYDLILHQARGEFTLNGMTVATSSRVQKLPAIGEPERPIDVGLNDKDGINFHWRRNMKFGRPGETKPDAVPGIPIGYIQRKAGALDVRSINKVEVEVKRKEGVAQTIAERTLDRFSHLT